MDEALEKMTYLLKHRGLQEAFLIHKDLSCQKIRHLRQTRVLELLQIIML
jgi:hypothetical protein